MSSFCWFKRKIQNLVMMSYNDRWQLSEHFWQFWLFSRFYYDVICQATVTYVKKQHFSFTMVKTELKNLFLFRSDCILKSTPFFARGLGSSEKGDDVTTKCWIQQINWHSQRKGFMTDRIRAKLNRVNIIFMPFSCLNPN